MALWIYSSCWKIQFQALLSVTSVYSGFNLLVWVRRTQHFACIFTWNLNVASIKRADAADQYCRASGPAQLPVKPLIQSVYFFTMFANYMTACHGSCYSVFCILRDRRFLLLGMGLPTTSPPRHESHRTPEVPCEAGTLLHTSPQQWQDCNKGAASWRVFWANIYTRAKDEIGEYKKLMLCTSMITHVP